MPIWEVETPNGIIEVDSPEPPTPDVIEAATAQFQGANINTGGTAGSGATPASNPSKGGGMFGRLYEDVSGMVDMIKGLPSMLRGSDPMMNALKLSEGQPTDNALDRMIGTGRGMVEAGAANAQPFLEEADQETGLARIGRLLQAGGSTIPGFGRTIQSGEDFAAGKEGAGGELVYDTAMALSPKLGPKVNAGIDTALDAGKAKVGKLGQALEQNAVTRLDDISNVPRPGISSLMSDPDLWKKRILAAGAGGMTGADPSTMLGMALIPDVARGIKTSSTLAKGQASLGRMLAPDAPMPRRSFMSNIGPENFDGPIGPMPAPNRVPLADELWDQADNMPPPTLRDKPVSIDDFEPAPYENLPTIGKAGTRRVPGEDMPRESRPKKSRPVGKKPKYEDPDEPVKPRKEEKRELVQPVQETPKAPGERAPRTRKDKMDRIEKEIYGESEAGPDFSPDEVNDVMSTADKVIKNKVKNPTNGWNEVDTPQGKALGYYKDGKLLVYGATNKGKVTDRFKWTKGLDDDAKNALDPDLRKETNKAAQELIERLDKYGKPSQTASEAARKSRARYEFKKRRRENRGRN